MHLWYFTVTEISVTVKLHVDSLPYFSQQQAHLRTACPSRVIMITVQKRYLNGKKLPVKYEYTVPASFLVHPIRNREMLTRERPVPDLSGTGKSEGIRVYLHTYVWLFCIIKLSYEIHIVSTQEVLVPLMLVCAACPAHLGMLAYSVYTPIWTTNTFVCS